MSLCTPEILLRNLKFGAEGLFHLRDSATNPAADFSGSAIAIGDRA